MNGIHDMGGLHGFGRVETEPDEPVFHARWEGRVFGIVQSLPGGNIDAGRHTIERLGPVSYLRNGYYGRWLAALERTLEAHGVLGRAEIESRMLQPRAQVRKASPSGRTPPPPSSYARVVARAALYAVGSSVRTRNHQPEGHTRLPAYARCRRGTIVHVHPAMVYPDDHAHGRGENPQYLYSVRFAGSELFGPQAEPGTAVYVDLFEPYLEPA